MLGRIRRRPSTYVALCAVGVITLFVVRGDLRIEKDPSRGREVAANEPRVLHNRLPAPKRAVERVALAGRVSDTLGHALPGAKVSAAEGESVLTAEDGSFELSTELRPYTDLIIEASGHRSDLVRISVEAPGPLLVQLEPGAPWDPEVLEPAAALALKGEGLVRDREGQPVTGAFVTEEGSGLWSRTDDIGRYTVALSGSIVRLLVHRPATDDSPALAARSEPVELSRSRGSAPLPELIVDEGGSIHGVLRARDGSPAVGVPVAIEGIGSRYICESGISGHFYVDGLVRGDYQVTPMAWKGSIGRPSTIRLEEDRAVCELQLDPVETKKVQVCREDGGALGNAIVASIVDGQRRFVAQADADGWANVGLLPSRTDYEVRADDSFEPFVVQRFDEAGAQLIVALP